MKKIHYALVALLFVLVGCGTPKEEQKVTPEVSPEDAFTYTFDFDGMDYRFRLLDGWVKFPDKDTNIAFLVGNKDIKSLMTAGFEPKESQSLEDYQENFLKKITDGGGKILSEPQPKTVHDLEVYHIGFKMKDAKDRWLTYRTHLIETPDYFINLGAWTSEEAPSEGIINHLDAMLDTFELLGEKE